MMAKHRTKAIEKGIAKKKDGAMVHFKARNFVTLVVALCVGYVHQLHVSSLLESDRHFSHLSTLEREMSFRTEMGLYYSYFKTVIEAPSFLDGVYFLYNNNLTEYPDSINTLQRFNLYPEIILGGSFRVFEKLSESMKWKTKECWKVNRGDNLSPVWSCEGIGDPAYFYLNGVWIFAAFTMTCIFLLATELSGSICGGLLAVLCYFYNHGECTRVMWTPPLRESFAYPISVANIFILTSILRKSDESEKVWKIAGLSITATLYMAFWQFAQFTLFTQICSLFPVFAVGLVSKEKFRTILNGYAIGLLFALALLFGNKMLMTSWLASSVLASYVILWTVEAFDKARLKGEQSVTSLVFYGAMKSISFLALTMTLKIVGGKILDVKDDDHIFNLLRSKFTDYRDFHTMLYTCSKEFDFLGWEMPLKGSQTLLVPSALLVIGFLCYNTFTKYIGSSKDSPKPEIEDTLTLIDSAVVYNLLQLLAYAAIAIMIMRLKLFFVPQLCVVASLLGNKKFIPLLKDNPTWHGTALVALIACMSVQGFANINQQRSIMGEYSNLEFEELIEWINATTPVEASFAGPMPVMANVLLSTRRPVINHPHYEDVGMRNRTKKIYEMYSRRTPQEYFQTLLDLKAAYLVISKGWCFNIHMSNDCGMTDLFDIEEPERREKSEPLCPKLFQDRPEAIRPFKKVFQNSEYVVLRLPTVAK